MKTIKWNLLWMLCSCITAFSQPPDVISLSGEWKFALDSLDKGEQEEWFNTIVRYTLCCPNAE